MAPEKVTEMVLNVDLKCSGCYKKVKKVICKIPQIRDQLFDVERNKVKIIVVCCSPEKIRDKLCYKGGGAIQSIEIIEKSDKPKEAADKPKEGDKPKAAPAAVDKPKPASDKPKPAADKPKEAEKPKPAGEKPKDSGKPKEPEKAKAAADKPKENEKAKPADKPKESGKPPEAAKPKPKEGEKPKEAEKPKDAGPPKEAPKKADAGPNPDVAKMIYEPVHGYPQMYPQSGYPMLGYGQYYDQGYQHGYAMQVAPPPPPTYGGFGYEHGYNGHNPNRNHYMSNDYGGEEDGESCSIM
uniref:pollen-specific leucine-rich repeat extensin-like protein 2 n=1 Tax=Erigeron canadensis TaxID=72917 RepID=UPI001CB8F171|nr:pollen-specific leucine-rich repeat extensin-like protein 2 [Erigeron canadensis]